jgi:hypothetical protein
MDFHETAYEHRNLVMLPLRIDFFSANVYTKMVVFRTPVPEVTHISVQYVPEIHCVAVCFTD